MSLINKYHYFKKGIIKKYVDETIQKLFYTNPTEEQLILIDEIIHKNENAYTWIVIIYSFIGIIAGFIIGLYSKGFICL